MIRKIWFLSIFLLVSPHLFAASSQFLSVESFYIKPQVLPQVLPYAVNVASYPTPFAANSIQYLSQLKSDIVYATRVKVNNVLYYRLVSGNFATLAEAKKHLDHVKKYYPDAWLNIRRIQEKKELTELLSPSSNRKLKSVTIAPEIAPVVIPEIAPIKILKKTPKEIKKSAENTTKVKPKSFPKLSAQEPPVPATKKAEKVMPIRPENEFAKKLLEEARQAFLDRKYPRVITISEKVIEIGSPEQIQRAMEFAGIARERQRKYSQAVSIYKQFLEFYPESKLAPRIQLRLTGLTTMRDDPKSLLAKTKSDKTKDSWIMNGSLSQYYRDDVVEIDTLDSQEVNSSLVTDVNFYARKKTDKSTLVFRLDAGLINDFIDKENDGRINRAVVNYTDNENDYQLIGGRQSRTAKGVLGRFDGLVYKGFSHTDFNYSLYAGFPVQSSYDGFDSERQFAGGSINFKPFEKVEMDVYLMQQQISGLTDRQALGTEFQYRTDKGFMYGIIDYDLFYSDVNNITAITNYRYSDKWVFNLTYDYRNSPLLSTLNAMQGQTVDSIKDLQDVFTDDQIYQLAEDRTNRGQNLFFGSNYQIDDERQLYLSMSLSSIAEGVESGGVAATPATDDINLSADYSIKSFFLTDDYTTFGMRLSDTSSSKIISLRARTRIAGSSGFRYDPRFGIDYRQSKTSDVDQYILKPSMKVTYKPNRKISFEGSLGIEYSNFQLPELNDQTQYDLYIGYVYRF